MAAALPAVQYFSSFSDAYKLEVRATGFSGEGDFYVLPFGHNDGLSDALAWQNEPANMIAVNYQHAVPADHDRVFFVPWTYAPGSMGRRPTMSTALDITPNNPFIMTAPFEKTIYMMPAPAGYSWEGHFHTIHSEDFSLFNLATRVSQVTLLETEEIYMNADGALHVGREQPMVYDGTSSINLYPGNGVVRWAGQMDNAATRIQLTESPAGGYFLNETNDLLPRSTSMTLYQEGEQIASDSLFNVPNLPVGRWLGHRHVTVQPGFYQMVVEDEHVATNGWHIRAKAELSFRTDLADPNPPRLTQLFVESEGQSRQMLYPDASHTLKIGVEDVCGWCSDTTPVDELQVKIKRLQDSTWQDLQFTPAARPGMYGAALPSGMAEGLYTIRVEASDASENTLVYELYPAFELGMSRIPVLLAPAAEQEDVNVMPTMTWHPIPDVQQYEVQIATDAAFADLVAQLDATEASLQLSALLEHGRAYHWRVRAHTVAGANAWSDARWFKTSPRVVREEEEVLIRPFTLDAVYPNPAYNQVAIKYAIPAAAEVRMEVFDVLGRRMQGLVRGTKTPGEYQQIVNVGHYAPGTYVVRLEAGTFVATRTFVRR